jgi:hypothetical protein
MKAEPIGSRNYSFICWTFVDRVWCVGVTITSSNGFGPLSVGKYLTAVCVHSQMPNTQFCQNQHRRVRTPCRRERAWKYCLAKLLPKVSSAKHQNGLLLGPAMPWISNPKFDQILEQ